MENDRLERENYFLKKGNARVTRQLMGTADSRYHERRGKHKRRNPLRDIWALSVYGLSKLAERARKLGGGKTGRRKRKAV